MNINNAIVRGINILTFLAENEKPATLSEISRELKIPKSSALDLLHTLVLKNFVEVANPEFKTYQLGIGMFLLGAHALNRNSLQTVSEPFLDALCEKTGKTVFLAVPKGKRVVYVTKKVGASPLQTASSVGFTNPMHLTALGKSILASKTDAQILEFYGPGPYECRTPASIGTYESLIEKLAQVRKLGYAFEIGESLAFIRCFASPIYDYKNEVIGAVSLVCLTNEVGEKEELEYPKMVMRTALDISQKLGYKKSKLYE